MQNKLMMMMMMMSFISYVCDYTIANGVPTLHLYRALTDLLEICKDRDNIEYTLKVCCFIRTFLV